MFTSLLFTNENICINSVYLCYSLSSSDDEWVPPKRLRHTSRAGSSVRRRSAQQAASSAESWHDISDADEDPAVNFFPKCTPGPQLVTTATYSPLELFQLFFTSSVIGTIIKNTNEFAAKRVEVGKKFIWIPLAVKDVLAYIGIVIYMGLVNAKTIGDYWARKDIYSFPFPQFAMSRSRFQSISWNLHLSNIKDDEENARKKGTPDYDRLYKIKPLYTDIVSAWKTYFHPRKQLIAVDERMVSSKARIVLKQCMKDKPTKWGYKLFVLADSICGYTWNFYAYERKSSTETGKGLSYESVMRLLDLSLLGQGYHIFMDNFYTSLTLFSDLLLKYTQACGTIRPNRQGFPKTKVNDLSRKAKRGEIRWIRYGKLLFVKWMDTREVTMCSTIHKSYNGDTVNRRVKTAESGWRRHQVPVPVAVMEYNKYMGGVDLSDALIGYYNVLHKTKKWYKTFFFHFIDIAVVNSYILHSELSKLQNKTPLTQKIFRELLSELISGTTEQTTSAASSSHAPAQMCLPEYFGSDARRICVLCQTEDKKVKTPVYCVKCNVALCFVSSRNCFQRWHTEEHSS
uniref:PiggyBac transposable element-derived protein domain-containing protein n=1 Tax=Sinocyclocheilus anshuiensis TaxID=1608454 RepID=A0A671SE46_9TELE